MTARERVIAEADAAIRHDYPAHVIDYETREALWLLACALADIIIAERASGFARKGAPGSSRIKDEPNTNATLVSGEEPQHDAAFPLLAPAAAAPLAPRERALSRRGRGAAQARRQGRARRTPPLHRRHKAHAKRARRRHGGAPPQQRKELRCPEVSEPPIP